MTPLIDATEMYLRTVWELEEEGIQPIRARLVERLGLSAPAVSETVARLEAEHLIEVGENRTLRLTDEGRQIATSVMRKHRLAELLLTEVIGLEWEQVHEEACRWEHVISDAVEERLITLLDNPTVCPHGNPVPGIVTTGSGVVREAAETGLLTMTEAAKSGGEATIHRISERLQTNVGVMRRLRTQGLRPGRNLWLRWDDGSVAVELDGETVTVPHDIAELVYVRGPRF